MEKICMDSFLKGDDGLNVIPADIELSKIHKSAMYMREIDEAQNQKKCRCCHEIYDAPLLGLRSRLKCFASYGSGFVSYFKMIKYLCFLLFLLLAVSGVSIALNVRGLEQLVEQGILDKQHVGIENKAQTLTDSHSQKLLEYKNSSTFRYYLLSTSHYNIEEESTLTKQIRWVLPILMSILFYFGWRYYYKRLQEYDIKIFNKIISPSHYSIMLSGLPTKSDQNQNDIIRELLHPQLSLYSEDVISHINFTFDLSPYMSLKRKVVAMAKDKIKVVALKREYHKETQLRELKEKLRQYEDFTVPIKKGAVAIVTFKYPGVCSRIIEEYKYTHMEYLKGKSKLNYKKKPVFLKRAPQPKEINWENIKNEAKYSAVILSWIWNICFFSFWATLNLFLVILVAILSMNLVLLPLKLLITILVTPILNAMLGITISMGTKLEKHITHTAFETSLTLKLSISMFANTVLFKLLGPVVVGFFKISETRAAEGILLEACFNTWISICLIQPLLGLIDVGYFIYLFKMWWYKEKKSRKKFSQLELNQIYTPPKFPPMSKKYADVLLNLFYTFFFLDVFPVGIIISMIGLMICYITHKYLMSKRYQKPDFNFSTEVSTYSMCLLLFGFAIIYYQFRHITLFIICALILIFTDKKRIFPKAKLSTTDKFDNIPFNLAQFEKNSYLWENPLTRARTEQMFNRNY